MVEQLLEEVRSAPLDEKGRARLAEIHHRSIAELEDGLAPELVEELERIALPFKDDSPSDAELRIAQAQLVGWLEGLFHGIQTALVAQQMAAQAQLQQMRALPPGTSHPGTPSQGPPGCRRRSARAARGATPRAPASTSDPFLSPWATAWEVHGSRDLPGGRRRHAGAGPSGIPSWPALPPGRCTDRVTYPAVGDVTPARGRAASLLDPAYRLRGLWTP